MDGRYFPTLCTVMQLFAFVEPATVSNKVYFDYLYTYIAYASGSSTSAAE